MSKKEKLLSYKKSSRRTQDIFYHLLEFFPESSQIISNVSSKIS